MKFLVTGSIRSPRGPRLIVSLTLLGFLAFFAAYWAREYLTVGFWPAELVAGIRGDAAGAGLSPVLVLEELHVDLLSHAVLLLFLTSLLFQLPYSERLKKILSGAAFATCLLYIGARAGVAFAEGFSYVAFVAGLFFLGIGLILFALTFLYLFRSDAR